ncbi:hypothetical protein MBLNU230_g1493t1 [Neophaeotheca triangularis]
MSNPFDNPFFNQQGSNSQQPGQSSHHDSHSWGQQSQQSTTTTTSTNLASQAASPPQPQQQYDQQPAPTPPPQQQLPPTTPEPVQRNPTLPAQTHYGRYGYNQINNNTTQTTTDTAITGGTARCQAASQGPQALHQFDERVKFLIAQISTCPMGYGWHLVEEGYRCNRLAHWISHEDIDRWVADPSYKVYCRIGPSPKQLEMERRYGGVGGFRAFGGMDDGFGGLGGGMGGGFGGMSSGHGRMGGGYGGLGGFGGL